MSFSASHRLKIPKVFAVSANSVIFMQTENQKLKTPRRLTLGYIRVSTDRQDLSIEAQTASVQRAAEYHKSGELSLFAEPDTSGRIEFSRRKEGAELLAAARQAAGE